LTKTQISFRCYVEAASTRGTKGLLFPVLFLLILQFTPARAAAQDPNHSPAIHTTPAKAQSGLDGIASFYGQNHQGKKTANGEIFDMNQLTAAHRSLPFGAKIKVTNLSNNRSVIVRINDRGPYIRGRVIDLSQAAAERLKMIQDGIVKVKIEVLDADRLR